MAVQMSESRFMSAVSGRKVAGNFTHIDRRLNRPDYIRHEELSIM
jgi:hypothetical protein